MKQPIDYAFLARVAEHIAREKGETVYHWTGDVDQRQGPFLDDRAVLPELWRHWHRQDKNNAPPPVIYVMAIKHGQRCIDRNYVTDDPAQWMETHSVIAKAINLGQVFHWFTADPCDVCTGCETTDQRVACGSIGGVS